MNKALHSTMFLLIQSSIASAAKIAISFTFHYVSINTKCIQPYTRWYLIFTFHYVSINTADGRIYLTYIFCFTFHYVSINTGSREPRMVILLTLHSTIFLLILSQCLCMNIPQTALHSTMFLLIHLLGKRDSSREKLYIPLCFY